MSITIEEMTREDLDNMMNDYECSAIKAGFANSKALELFKYNASMGLIKFGGSFSEPLGHALACTDMHNTVKLINAFREECTEHALLYLKWNSNRDE